MSAMSARVRLSTSRMSLLLAGFALSACTAILVPDQDDDGVARCNNTEDCVQPSDNRFQAVCVFGEGQADNSDKICAPEFQEINCNPEAYSGDHPFVVRYGEATTNQAKAEYGACEEENRGKRGCQPQDQGVCESGLELNSDGYCDDPDASIPAIYPPIVGGVDIAGQDALDQFCAWYFCGEDWVCDTGGPKWTCKPCSSSDPFGEGGCGQLYIEGEPSPIYQSLDGGNCNDGTKADTEVVLGAAPGGA